MKPYNGRLHNDKWLHVAVRPFTPFANPGSALVQRCLRMFRRMVDCLSRICNRHLPQPNHLWFLSTLHRPDILIPIHWWYSRNGPLRARSVTLLFKQWPKGMEVSTNQNSALSWQLLSYWSQPSLASWVLVGQPRITMPGSSLDDILWPHLIRLFVGLNHEAITFCVDSYRQYAGEALEH